MIMGILDALSWFNGGTFFIVVAVVLLGTLLASGTDEKGHDDD